MNVHREEASTVARMSLRGEAGDEDEPYKREAVSFGLDNTLAGDIDMWLPDYVEDEDEDPIWLCEYETEPKASDNTSNKRSSWFSIGDLIMDRRLSGHSISQQAAKAKSQKQQKASSSSTATTRASTTKGGGGAAATTTTRGRGRALNNSVKRTRSRSVATLKLGKENEDFFGNKKKPQKSWKKNNGLDGYLSNLTPLASLMEGVGGGGTFSEQDVTRESFTSGMSVLERREARMKKRETMKPDSSSQRGNRSSDSASQRGNRSRRIGRRRLELEAEVEAEEEDDNLKEESRRRSSGSSRHGRRRAVDEEEKPDYNWAAKGSMSSSAHDSTMSGSAPGRMLPARTRSNSMSMITSVKLVKPLRADRDGGGNSKVTSDRKKARGRTKEELLEDKSTRQSSDRRGKNRSKSPKKKKKQGSGGRKEHGSSIKGKRNVSGGGGGGGGREAAAGNAAKPSASLLTVSASFANSASIAADAASRSVTMAPILDQMMSDGISSEIEMQEKLAEIVAAAEAAAAAVAKAQEMLVSFNSYVEDGTEATFCESSDDSSEFLPPMKPFHRCSSL